MEYIEFLKEKEEELNNIGREKGFEVTIENPYCKYDTILGELIVKNLDNNYPSNFTIKVKWNNFDNTYNSNSIDILENGRWVDSVDLLNTLPKLIYNYFNIDKLNFVCRFEGGKYDKKVMSREEIEKLSFRTNLSKNSTFMEMIKYTPFMNRYHRAKRSHIDYGTIYFTLIDSSDTDLW